MEYIKVYLEENNKITEKVIDVNEVSHYVGMGWSLEKPKTKEEKFLSKKEHKKEKIEND